MSTHSLFTLAQCALEAVDPQEKIARTKEAHQAWQRRELDLNDRPYHPPIPGRPNKPELVQPNRLPRRTGLRSSEHKAALLHALAHIEFNAINLAWDAVYRFRGMPEEYYTDWLQVAFEEAKHFALLVERLAELDARYGDFPAHNGLWEMAEETQEDPLKRMALVPRVLEARGLDVTQGIIEKFAKIGDDKSVDTMTLIRNEEVAHVAAGSRWFRYLCRQRALHPEDTFFTLLAEGFRGKIKGPLDLEARKAAGFSAEELSRLQALAGMKA